MLQIAGAKVRSANMTKAENLQRGDTQGALLVGLKCKVRTRKCENNQCGMGRADFTFHLRDDHAHIETPELCTSTSSSASKSSSIPVGEDLEKPCEPNATLQYSLLPVKAKRKSNMDLTTSNPGKRSTRATYWSKELMIHASDHFDIVNGHPLSGAIINVASPEVAT